MYRVTRRRFPKYGLRVSEALGVPWALRTPEAHAAAAGKLAKYVQPPLPGAGVVVATPRGTNKYLFRQCEISRQLRPQLPPTPLWAYGGGSDSRAGPARSAWGSSRKVELRSQSPTRTTFRGSIRVGSRWTSALRHWAAQPTPFATGPMLPPAPEERGFKDTVKANPGYFTTIRAKFDLPAGVSAPQYYVHHCHIVEHEDNDMMRPFTVVP